jgi:hypothetical protein
MPVIRDIKLELPFEQLLRREGFRKHVSPSPAIQKVILEMLNNLEHDSLLEPVIAYEIMPVERMINDEQGTGRISRQNSRIFSVISGARELAAAVCTIGKKLEMQVKQFIESNEPLRALLMDGIGSAAVDILSEEACNLISSAASLRGYMAGSPISPGMQGLSITEQTRIFELVPASEIGVSLTDSGMMIPLKSASMVTGLGPEMKRWKRVEVCASCHLRSSCPYRLEI